VGYTRIDFAAVTKQRIGHRIAAVQLMLRHRPGQRRQIGQRRVIKQFAADFDPVSARLLDNRQQRTLTAESGDLCVAVTTMMSGFMFYSMAGLCP